MHILHGDNIITSREKRTQLLSEMKAKGYSIVQLEASKLSRADLESALSSQDLFGTTQCVCIDGLHSLPTSQRKKDLLTLLANYVSQPLILWEKRALTKTMLNVFSGAVIEEFKTSNSLFTWLESLGTSTPTAKKLQLLQDAVRKDGEYLCFLMLIRQLRQLLTICENGTVAGAPFVVAKLKKQATAFTTPQLLELYQKLAILDEQSKTSKALLPLAAELDLLTTKL